MVSNIPGDNTIPIIAEGCPPGIDTILWQMNGAPHTPALDSTFGESIFVFLNAHPKVRSNIFLQ
jgi:hypothetical protein